VSAKQTCVVVFQRMEFISYGNSHDSSVSQIILLKFKQSNSFLFYCIKLWLYKLSWENY